MLPLSHSQPQFLAPPLHTTFNTCKPHNNVSKTQRSFRASIVYDQAKNVLSISLSNLCLFVSKLAKSWNMQGKIFPFWGRDKSYVHCCLLHLSEIVPTFSNSSAGFRGSKCLKGRFHSEVIHVGCCYEAKDRHSTINCIPTLKQRMKIQ